MNRPRIALVLFLTLPPFLLAGACSESTTNPTSPTSPTPPTTPTNPPQPSNPLLVFGFPSASNPSSAASELPIQIYVDGRPLGTISAMWNSGLITEPGPGRIGLTVTPGVHSYFAMGRTAAWQDDNLNVTSQGVVRHLLCSNCTGVQSGQFENFGTFRGLPGDGLEICIRDHECEDGDRVSVMLNGQAVFTNEKILNGAKCRTVGARLGLNDILFRADNGTGFEGATCSHADANTGQITVRGSDRSQTQTWSLRGGAGTTARLAVIR